ncbi:MAG TPA: hypothetical protein VKB59_12080 [Micromonosporaceae bacterium]|nr:hypothetical protein [Micromonosporaceae bacterium]
MADTTPWVPRPDRRRRWLVSVAAASAVGAGALLGAAPAYAASGADLTVSLANEADAVPGEPITYIIGVADKGPSKAAGLSIDFTTSAALTKVTYSIIDGRCHTHAKEVTCRWKSALPVGHHRTITITGVMSSKIAKGTHVTNSVTVHSTTKRINKADDKATDNYVIGVPQIAAPVAVPTPSINPTSKLAHLTKTAAKMADYSSHIVFWTLIVLGAAFVWFSVGLALHHRRRAAEADFDANDFHRDDEDT